jgi:alpha-D-ribose 1-methylphosphonate 5-phosphate C-P lyase
MIQFGSSRIYTSGAEKELMEPGHAVTYYDFENFPGKVQQYEKDGDLSTLQSTWQDTVRFYARRHSTD